MICADLSEIWQNDNETNIQRNFSKFLQIFLIFINKRNYTIFFVRNKRLIDLSFFFLRFQVEVQLFVYKD